MTKRDRGARGTASVRGGAEGLPTPQCRDHLLARGPWTQPLRRNPAQLLLRENNERAGGGARGRPRRNNKTISRRAGHRCSLCHFSSATAATEHSHDAGGKTSMRGGGARVHRRCNTETICRRGGHGHSLCIATQRNRGARKMTSARGGGTRGRSRRNAETISWSTGHQCSLCHSKSY